MNEPRDPLKEGHKGLLFVGVILPIPAEHQQVFGGPPKKWHAHMNPKRHVPVSCPAHHSPRAWLACALKFLIRWPSSTMRPLAMTATPGANPVIAMGVTCFEGTLVVALFSLFLFHSQKEHLHFAGSRKNRCTMLIWVRAIAEGPSLCSGTSPMLIHPQSRRTQWQKVKRQNESQQELGTKGLARIGNKW